MENPRGRIRASGVALDRDAAELVVTWQDGRQSRFGLAQLRRHCPCAGCQEIRRRAAAPTPGELVVLDPHAAAASAAAVRVEPVGRYGLRLVWADGHDHGIYTFEALRGLDDAVTG